MSAPQTDNHPDITQVDGFDGPTAIDYQQVRSEAMSHAVKVTFEGNDPLPLARKIAEFICPGAGGGGDAG